MSASSHRALNEIEVCDQHITPALVRAGWDTPGRIRREFVFTDGRVILRGKLAVRGRRKRADYLLFIQPNLPIAIVEAKDQSHPVGGGMQQALEYAAILDVPFVFASNGTGFVFHDRTAAAAAGAPIETSLTLDQFPSPDALWQRYRAWKGLTDTTERQIRVPFHEDASSKEPRYYQRIAIQRTIEAVARGDRRILLAMSTGTGKTYTAFQIIWRLWKSGVVKRVLFLADRNILVDQTITNDFKPFGGVMTKVSGRTVDKSYEVYLALYQAVTGTDEERNTYKQFSPDFFDLVVIDECHRGSAKEDSAWREILDYFGAAIQLGLTATPKETREVSTLTYFGPPLYTYSLKQGIDDGFLAPYKVVRVDLDKDLEGWRPTRDQVDDLGQLIEDRVYNARDMDRVLVLDERTQRVAEKVVAYLAGTDPFGKTIVFCHDIDHAERMRSALVNEVARQMPSEAGHTTRFVVRITGDNDLGKRALDDFIHPERRYPVIATTSKLLTTGVDAKTCKLVVLDQRIESMIEFKQIIGRGTRIHEDTGKLWFTIMDFRKATELFADKAWDGDPKVVYTPGDDDPIVPPEVDEGDVPDGDHDGGDAWGDPDAGAGFSDPDPGDGPAPGGDPRVKYRLREVAVKVVAERVQYYDQGGKLITESLTDYTRHAVERQYPTLATFLGRWNAADRKQAVLDELVEHGVLLDALRDQIGDHGHEVDPFDLVCHVVYDRPPLTRRERAANVRKRDVFTRFGPAARAVLDALLDKYAEQGVVPDDLGALRVRPIADLGTPVELVSRFGGKDGYVEAVRALEAELYRDAG
ncbi:MAG: DEAD/DEAH box helicase family protein [Deltaproteobacteria bacterium]|nr:DEAD/DEAH box helicase family protein [Deltaproteobacteria bacterium]